MQTAFLIQESGYLSKKFHGIFLDNKLSVLIEHIHHFTDNLSFAAVQLTPLADKLPLFIRKAHFVIGVKKLRQRHTHAFTNGFEGSNRRFSVSFEHVADGAPRDIRFLGYAVNCPFPFTSDGIIASFCKIENLSNGLFNMG